MRYTNIADCSKKIGITTALLLSLVSTVVMADEHKEEVLRVDKQQVKAWNEFADRLYELHKVLIAQHEIRTESSQGGYAAQPNIYTETRYIDKQNNHLLSRIQRMNHNPKLIQLIEVNIYGKTGKLVRDYLAAYLPFNRNAPIQTLINLHGYHGELHGFRQFDASGERIYEQCEGHYAGKPVMISLEEYEFGKGPYRDNKTLGSAIYKNCFADIPTSAQPYLNPANEIALLKVDKAQSVPETADDLARLIEDYSQALKQNPKDVALLIKRGDIYFKLHEFEQAIEDYSDAISLDKQADAAYFGRGMALGRYGQIREGIGDLTIYIQRHPDNSRAYTKRGVRYLWIHDDTHAEKDFVRAIELNPANAEAHDDLGVIFARLGKYEIAMQHFTAAVTLDPTYFKAFHNQAMVYYINGQDILALSSVNKSLELVPDQRNALLLKADILHALGRESEAKKVKGEAEFLPEGNWSEHISVE
jgi:tetratricopeptide (TPR) repeat protein